MSDSSERAVHSNIAACLRKLDQNADAVAFARRCIELSPEWPKGYFHLASALLALPSTDGRALQEAREAVERAAQLASDDSSIAALRERVQAAQRATEAARAEAATLAALVQVPCLSCMRVAPRVGALFVTTGRTKH